MNTDLDERIGRRFQPETPRDFFALQLARRLSDESALRRYVDLSLAHPIPFLLDVFEQAKEEATTPDELRERFWAVLEEQVGRRTHA